MDRPSVHVVIVNWNSGAQLRDCLRSFVAVADDAVALDRVTVVDNASTDGSAEDLNTTLPLVVIRNADNRGFAARTAARFLRDGRLENCVNKQFLVPKG